MKRIETYTYLDESGFHGLVDRTNNSINKNDIGLVAGFIFPCHHIDKYNAELESIFSKIEGNFRKLHSREVFVDNQNQNVRKEFFNWLIKTDELIVISHAIYAYALFMDSQKKVEFREKHLIKDPIYKTSKNYPKRRLTVEAFKPVIFYIENICHNENSETEIIFDKLDKPILNDFKKELERMKTSTVSRKSSSFNTKTSEVEKRTYEITTKCNIDYKIKHITNIREVNEKEIFLSFASDIISNSLNWYLKEKVKAEGASIRLNSKLILEDYVLSLKMPYLFDDNILDNIYSNE